MKTSDTAQLAAGCLVGSIGFCIWVVLAFIVICLKVAVLAAIIAGVYWCFTGDWIGDAAFLQ